MTKEEFLKLIENNTFSFSEEKDIYYCNGDLNVTMEFITTDNYKDEYDIHFYLKETGSDPRHFKIKYYYNDVLIHTECGIYSSKIMNSPLLLPYPNEYKNNGEFVDFEYLKTKSPVIFGFNEKKIYRLNNLVGFSSDEKLKLTIDYLKHQKNVKFE